MSQYFLKIHFPAGKLTETPSGKLIVVSQAIFHTELMIESCH